jgi:ribosomal protein S18 acetylase RimI-like enzyme
VSSPGELVALDADLAAIIVEWVHSAEELAVVAGPTLQWPLTVDQLMGPIGGVERYAAVLLDAGRPVAFGTLRRYQDSVRLGWILVDPQRRGAGWGRRLMEQLIREAGRRHGPRRLTLGVYTHNLPALELYRSLGFSEQPPVPIDFEGYPWQKIEMELIAIDEAR